MAAISGSVMRALKKHGLLLLQDAALPSVASLVAGEPVSGSWWGHKKGRDIWLASEALADHPDVLTVKLVSGKVTFVHRRLWPAVLSVASSREPWQTQKLSPVAMRLLALVGEEGEVRTDAVRLKGAAAAKELECRLLVHSDEIHTKSGAHAKRLSTWERWSRREKLTAKTMPPAKAKKILEEALARLCEPNDATARLPWQKGNK